MLKKASQKFAALKLLNFMAPFYGWGSTASRLQHFEEAPLSS